jgi:pSer/pThr/pTyr-binding forkhead associated (FHA) protein
LIDQERKVELTLLIKSGDDAGKRITIPGDAPFRIGRSTEAEFRYSADSLLSALHFAIETNENNCIVRDLGSRFGTSVNGIKIAESAIHDGDEILAGRTVFSVMLAGGSSNGAHSVSASSSNLSIASTLSAVQSTNLASTASASATQSQPRQTQPLSLVNTATPAPSPAKRYELTAAQQKIIQHLRQTKATLFGLFDAAREPSIIARIQRAAESESLQYQCLYDGEKGDDYSAFGPWLIQLPKETKFLEELVAEGWGKSWGVYLICDKPFADTRRHLRKFLMVTLPDGRQVFFRFYDPRVLRTYLPTCNESEVKEFAGPIDRYLAESVDGEELLEFAANFRDWQKVRLMS